MIVVVGVDESSGGEARRPAKCFDIHSAQTCSPASGTPPQKTQVRGTARRYAATSTVGSFGRGILRAIPYDLAEAVQLLEDGPVHRVLLTGPRLTSRPAGRVQLAENGAVTSNDPDESGGFASGHPPRPDKPIRNDTAETLWVELRGDGGRHSRAGRGCRRRRLRAPTRSGRRDVTAHPPRARTGGSRRISGRCDQLPPHRSGRANDMVFSLRVVPERREPGVVFAWTLRRDEPDDGRRVHVRPGEQLTLAPGSVSVALDAIDDYYRSVDPERPEGSLASALRVWFGMKSDVQAETLRLAGAAAHRLDAAEHLLRRAELIRSSLVSEDGLGGPQLVAKVDEFIHLVQEGVVALARCIALLRRVLRFRHSR